MYLYTNVTQDPEAVYIYGWVFIGLLFLMLIVNLTLVLQMTISTQIIKLKKFVALIHNQRKLLKMEILHFRDNRTTCQRILEYLMIDAFFL